MLRGKIEFAGLFDQLHDWSGACPHKELGGYIGVGAQVKSTGGLEAMTSVEDGYAIGECDAASAQGVAIA